MAEQLISDLRALTDDDGIKAVLQRAEDAATEDCLAFTAQDEDRQYLSWGQITTQLTDTGRAFGDMVYLRGLPFRAIAYDPTKDELWATSDARDNRIGVFVKYSTKTFEVEATTGRDMLIAAATGSHPIRNARRELHRIKSFPRQDGLYFDTRWGIGIRKAKFFSWESMTTDLGKHGHAFGDVVDEEGHRAVAYDGELWVADPGRAKTVHKL